MGTTAVRSPWDVDHRARAAFWEAPLLVGRVGPSDSSVVDTLIEAIEVRLGVVPDALMRPGRLSCARHVGGEHCLFRGGRRALPMARFVRNRAHTRPLTRTYAEVHYVRLAT